MESRVIALYKHGKQDGLFFGCEYLEEVESFGEQEDATYNSEIQRQLTLRTPVDTFGNRDAASFAYESGFTLTARRLFENKKITSQQTINKNGVKRKAEDFEQPQERDPKRPRSDFDLKNATAINFPSAQMREDEPVAAPMQLPRYYLVPTTFFKDKMAVKSNSYTNMNLTDIEVACILEKGLGGSVRK